MQRILQVVGGMNRAGAETFLMNVYRELDRNKIQFDFLVYTDKKQDYEEEIISLGGRVIHMPCSSGFGMLKSVKKIKNILREFGPYTAVHAHTLHNSAFAMLACKTFPNIKKIVHSHSTHNTVKTNVIKCLYEKWTMKVIRKHAQEWLACGEEAGAYLFGKQFVDKGLVVNNGVDVKKYFLATGLSTEETRKLGIDEETLVIGNVARLQPVKNHDFMLNVAKRLHEKNINFKMLFVGQGELEEPIQAKIELFGLQGQVILLGLREDIPSLLKTMDVFLMPSLFEGNPVTLVEAQASGLPCVISDTITEQMDMGLDLMTRCDLDADLDEWINALLLAKNKRNYSFEQVEKALQTKGYEVHGTVEKLMCIYEG